MEPAHVRTRMSPGIAFAALAFACMTSLAAVSSAHAATLDIKVLDQHGAPVADAVVYASTPNTVASKPPAGTLISQKNSMFLPLVTPIQTGTAIAFPNEDTVRHHVYSFSPAKIFELKLYTGTPREPVLFDKPGVVALGCNLHDNMLAYVIVVDTPYFAKTGAGGTARLDGLANGDVAVRVWHPRLHDATALPSATLDVRVPVVEPLTVRLQLVPLETHPTGSAK